MIIHHGEPCISCEHYSADTSDENHWVCDFDHDTCPYVEELHKAIGYAKLSSSEKPNKWIPVSERLPNLDDFTGTRRWQKKVLITGYLSFDDTKELFVSEAFAKDVIYNSVHDTVVTAWMPLPEPYKASPTGAEGSEE